MRSFALLVALGSALGSLGCSAPSGEAACQRLCDNRNRCGAVESERGCLWACLAGVEHRADKNGRCARAAREEYHCLGGIDDCEFLLEATRYGDDSPCRAKGSTRTTRCDEDGVDYDELVPLNGPEAWSAVWGDDYSDPAAP